MTAKEVDVRDLRLQILAGAGKNQHIADKIRAKIEADPSLMVDVANGVEDFGKVIVTIRVRAVRKS